MPPRLFLLCAFALMLALPLAAGADSRDEGKKAAPKPTRLAAEGKAAAFLKAFQAEDAARQAEMGPGFDPDPWMVAEVLCNAGEHAAALAFARVAPEKAAVGLEAYVARREKEAPEASDAARKAFGAMRAAQLPLLAKDFRAHIGAAMKIEGPLETVGRVRGEMLRASALRLVGRIPASIAACDDAIAAAKTLGWRQGEVAIELSRGRSLFMSGDARQAGRALRRAEKLATKLGAQRLQASAISNQGNVYYARADYQRALKLFERSIEIKQSIGDKLGAARSLANVGTIYLQMGKLSEALRSMELAVATFLEAGDDHGTAIALGNLGNVYLATGRLNASLNLAERALRLFRKTGDEQGAAMALLNLGVAWFESGQRRDPNDDASEKDLARSARYLAEAATMARALGARRLGLRIQLTQAGLARKAGDPDAALKSAEAALKEASALHDHEAVIQGELVTARAHRTLRDLESCAEACERAVAIARRIRADRALANALAALAVVRFDQGDNEAALRHATEGLHAAETVMGQLTDREAAGTRSRFADLFEVGAAAAARLDEVDETLRFLESGRAGMLLHALGGRDALRWAMQKIPEPLRAWEQSQIRAEQAARHAYEAGLRRRTPRHELQDLGKKLENAQRAVLAARSRIRREALREAGLFYPRAATSAEIQDTLEADQAAVIYGRARDEGHAVVITAEEQYLVKLGSWAALRRASGKAAIQDASADLRAPLAALRDLLVTPLKLPASVKEVLVSPALHISYAPWAALFNRSVALTPSGSTHTLLSELDFDPATGVLALGDPDYAGVSESTKRVYVRGGSLSALPGSGVEAKAVGTTVLLGAAATPIALRAALATQERWRAVHFACHGLLDLDNPRLCALALSAPKDGNGFLTTADVLGMQIPADIAVLSACETGRGQVVSGEGIVGMARAFMHAGAPRVLCSLWKVDDEATRALMIKFYELWNPKEGTGLPPAQALRRAQDHVKDQKKWAHPYYWAAWVLWGLPR